MMAHKFDFRQRIEILLKALTFLGVWKEAGKCYVFYSYVLWTSFNLFIVLEIVNLAYIVHDLDKLNLQILLILTNLFASVKVYFLMKYRKSILNLRDSVDSELFQPKNTMQEESTKHTFRIVDGMYFAFKLGPAFTILICGIYALAQGPRLRKLPFLAWYPYDCANSFVYSATFLHQILTQLWGAQIYINVDTLNFTLLAVIIAQFDILCDDILRAFDQKRTKRSAEETCGYLVNCVRHHKQILVFFKEVYAMLNMNLLIQFASTTSALCLLLLQLTIAEMNMQFFAIIFYVCTFLGELFLYCWWGNEVTLKSENLPRAAFESDWVAQPTPLKKNILYFIHRTQSPNILYAIDMFKVDLPNFLIILRLSYSSYTVLRRMNNR